MTTIYRVTANPGGLYAEGTESPLTVTGLTNGVDYTFTIKATNESGTSIVSETSYPVRVATTPSAPQNVDAVGGDSQIVVSFAAPSSNGGDTIYRYRVQATPGNIVVEGASSPLTLSGLADGTAYTITAYAINGKGAGSGSTPVVESTFSIPSAPQSVYGSRNGTGAILVYFDAPATDGGSEITGYFATSNAGNGASGTGSPINITGLTNGTSYTFTVRATNSIGNGPFSSQSASIAPGTVPGAPTIGTASAGDASAQVAFTPPGDNGGFTITEYTATSTPGSFTGTGSSSPVTVTGLSNGTEYTFKVKATNSIGTGSESSASNGVTPTVQATVPDAPTIGTATATGSSTASVTFTPPGYDGGSTITGYKLYSNGTPAGPWSGSNSPIVATGLTVDVGYTFYVKATNAIGDSSASGNSNTATPYATAPGIPTLNSATGGALATASVSFSAPSSNGGRTIQAYEVTATKTSPPLTVIASGRTSPIKVSGFSATSSYTFTILAKNEIGTGSSSGGTSAVVTTTTGNAGPPTSVSGSTPSAGQVQVSWSAPVWNGGQAVTSYDVIRYDESGTQTYTNVTSPYTISSLTAGTKHRLAVRANNATGNGAWSTTTSSLTVT